MHKTQSIATLLLVLLLATPALSQDAPLQFKKEKISDTPFEAASACDINRDGNMDIVSGEFWYAGPDFKKRTKITSVKVVSGYTDDFADFPMDVNGDGWIDIVTGAWFGQPLRWLENPKDAKTEWKTHEIAQVGNIETIRFWDVDGDGHPEIIPNAGGNILFYRLNRDANGKGTGEFTRHEVKMGGCGHGLGFGDINGDGRGDLLGPDGWFEAPTDPLTGKWTLHAEFKIEHASVPILVHDVNKDGLADLIVGGAHRYGIEWYEQKKTGEKREWVKHDIDTTRSQYHDLALADLDKDGEMELITGKRYLAHNGNDPGSADPLFLCYFHIDKGAFTRVTLNEGPPETASGAGIYLWTADMDNNGWLDIVAPGKEGLYLFRNQGR